jgi:predicted sugar kinase
MLLLNPEQYSENVPDWLNMYIQALEKVAVACDRLDYFPEEVEEVEKVVRAVEGGEDGEDEPSLPERIMKYLETGRHTMSRAVPMGEIAAILNADITDVQEAMEALNHQGKVDCISTRNARDDLVYLTEKK